MKSILIIAGEQSGDLHGEKAARAVDFMKRWVMGDGLSSFRVVTATGVFFAVCCATCLSAPSGHPAPTITNPAPAKASNFTTKVKWEAKEHTREITSTNVFVSFDVQHEVNDEAMFRHMFDRMVSIYQEGRTVPTSNLVAQLSRPRCDLQLPDAPVPRNSLSASGVYSNCVRSVLVIGRLRKTNADWEFKCSSSGFALNSGGAIVTAFHVVDAPDWAGLFAMTHQGEVYPVTEVLAANKESDLAILRIEAHNLAPAWLSDDAAVGDAAYCISNLGEEFYMFTAGMVCRYFRFASHGRDLRAMEISTATAHGSSGAPVFDACGGVVGVANANRKIRDDDVPGKRGEIQHVFTLCSPVRAIRDLLNEKTAPERKSQP